MRDYQLTQQRQQLSNKNLVCDSCINFLPTPTETSIQLQLYATMVQPSKEQLFGAVSSFLLKVIQLIVPFVFVQPSRNSDLFFSSLCTATGGRRRPQGNESEDCDGTP